ncbi:MAG: hypothetical protein DRI54_05415 [Bacteroidetes bacterium]|nr:MAG: hypothetical protein DRI54_05415 [Bacteroidota bacterium]
MKLKFTFLAFLLLIQLSCDQNERRPENIISEDSMVPILVDIQILEATYNNRLIHVEDRNERMERYYKEIFEKHQTSSDLFNESYSYYEEHPAILQAIYEVVLEKLEAMETKEETKQSTINSKKREEQKKKKKLEKEKAKINVIG